MKLYKLKFYTPLHLFSGGYLLEDTSLVLHSDTLYSAIFSKWGFLFPKDDIEQIISEQSFVISSGFPFCNKTLFFTKPFWEIKTLQENHNVPKQLKKLKFVSANVLLRILGDQKIDLSSESVINECFLIDIDKESVDMNNDILKIREVPRIMVPRDGSPTSIFYFGELLFNRKSGLFFLIDGKQEILRKIESIISMLADEGIGADRTTGRGLFRYQVEDFDLFDNLNGDKHLILSLYLPSKNEIIDKKLLTCSSYDFLLRGGFVTQPGASTLRRKETRFFVEGSVFGKKPEGSSPLVLEKGLLGRLPNNIYRVGKPLSIPFGG